MKAHDGPLLPVRQVLNAKERFLKEIKSAILANMPMIRKLNNLVAYVEKVLVVWIEDETSQPCVCVSVLSPVWLFAAPWTVAHQAPLSMEFSRQEYCSGLPFPTPGDLPDSGIKTVSLVPPTLAGRFFTTVPPGSPQTSHNIPIIQNLIEQNPISFQVYESWKRWESCRRKIWS